ncbi:hypothetical protein EMIT0P260_40305 [Pseudomonas sp. IT-P260]
MFARVQALSWRCNGARSLQMSFAWAVMVWAGTALVKPDGFAGMLPACRLVCCLSLRPLS